MKSILSELLALAFVFLFSYGSFSFAEAKDTEVKNPLTESVALNNLSNKELLQQTEAVLTQSLESFRAQQRGVQRSALRFQKAAVETKSLTIPSPTDDGARKVTSSVADPLKEAEQIVEYEKKRLVLLKKKAALLEHEKELLDKYISQFKDSRLAANLMQTVFEDLKTYLLEIQWRVEDGSLLKQDIPELLNRKKINAIQVSFAHQQEEMNKQQQDVASLIEDFVDQKEKLNQQIVATELCLSSAEKRYSHELNRDNLEQEFSAMQSDKLLRNAEEFTQEAVWLQSVFDQVLSRFTEEKEEISTADQQLEQEEMPRPLTESAVPVSSDLQGKELSESVQALDNLIIYYRERIQGFGVIKVSCERLVELGWELESDFIVLDRHFFKMQVLARILQQRIQDKSIKADQISPDFSKDTIMKRKEKSAQYLAFVLSAVKDIKLYSEQIDNEIKQHELSLQEAEKRKATCEQAHQLAAQLQDWNEKINKLTSEQLLQEFFGLTEKMESKRKQLATFREAFSQHRQELQEAENQLNRLEYPMLRLARQNSSQEKQKIFNLLVETTGIDVHNSAFQFAAAPDTSGPGKSGLNAIDKKNDNMSEQQNNEGRLFRRAGLKKYESLLSGNTLATQQRSPQLKIFLAALKEEDQYASHYLDVLTNIAALAEQRSSIAVELKKRVGTGQLPGSKLPDKSLLIESLKQEVVNRLKEEKKEVAAYQAGVNNRIEYLTPEKQGQQGTVAKEELFQSILKTVEERLDSIDRSNVLKGNFQRQAAELSEIEKTELEQAIAARLERDRTLFDFMLGLVPSEQADQLHTILKKYYEENMELERKLQNIGAQKKEINTMIQLSEQEMIAVRSLLTVIAAEKKILETEKEKQWVIIQARLVPRQADELVSTFEKKTGQAISTPEPLLAEQVGTAIEKAIDILFNHYIQIIALEEWAEVLNTRLSVAGIEKEINSYQEHLTDLNVLSNTVTRKMEELSGHSGVAPAQQQVSKKETLYFFEGKIGLLKKDIFDIRKTAVLWLCIKVFLILISSIVLMKILKMFLARRMEKYQEKESVLSTLMNNFLNGIIWTTAFVALLSTLGFNIGAIMAGLGIGGLALAMASKETLSDIIGGISIVMSKSFKAGDFLIYNGKMVTVDSVGIRYTRFTGGHTDNYLTVVPNSKLAEASIVNATGYTMAFRIEVYIYLSTRNNAEKIQLARALIEDICTAHSNVDFKWVVHFGFDKNSFVLRLRYDAKDISQKASTRNEVNTGITEQFQKHHIDFADKPYVSIPQK
jgi:MscS family membrane protein